MGQLAPRGSIEALATSGHLHTSLSASSRPSGYKELMDLGGGRIQLFFAETTLNSLRKELGTETINEPISERVSDLLRMLFNLRNHRLDLTLHPGNDTHSHRQSNGRIKIIWGCLE